MIRHKPGSYEYKKLADSLFNLHVELKALSDISPENEATSMLSVLISVPENHVVATELILEAIRGTKLWTEDWSVSITYVKYIKGGTWPL